MESTDDQVNRFWREVIITDVKLLQTCGWWQQFTQSSAILHTNLVHRRRKQIWSVEKFVPTLTDRPPQTMWSVISFPFLPDSVAWESQTHVTPLMAHMMPLRRFQTPWSKPYWPMSFNTLMTMYPRRCPPKQKSRVWDGNKPHQPWTNWRVTYHKYWKGP